MTAAAEPGGVPGGPRRPLDTLVVVITIVAIVVLAVGVLLVPLFAGSDIYFERPLLRLGLVLVLCFIFAAAFFWVVEGATASLQWQTGGVVAKLGGSIAGFFILFYAVTQHLTPTETLLVSIRDAGRGELPAGSDITINAEHAGGVMSAHGEDSGTIRFGLLPRGQVVTLTVEHPQWMLAASGGREDEAGCETTWSDPGRVKVATSCSRLEVGLAPRAEATFRHIDDYKTTWALAAWVQVNLYDELRRLRSLLEAWVQSDLVGDDKPAIEVDIEAAPKAVFERSFKAPSFTRGEYSLCQLVSVYENAFNNSLLIAGRRDERAMVIVERTRLVVREHATDRRAAGDDCAPEDV